MKTFKQILESIKSVTANDIEYEYDSYLEENPDTNPIDAIKAILDSMDVSYEEVEIPLEENSYIVTKDVVIEYDSTAAKYPLTFHKKDSFLYNTSFTNLESKVEEDYNRDFWDSPQTLYHATRNESVEGIKETGLNTSRGSGINNRGANGVFTVSNIELLQDGSYGPNIFEIDTSTMKKDGYKPFVSMEPDVLEGEVRGEVANLIGDDRYSPESYDGQWQETVIVGGKIGPKYLKLLEQ